MSICLADFVLHHSLPSCSPPKVQGAQVVWVRPWKFSPWAILRKGKFSHLERERQNAWRLLWRAGLCETPGWWGGGGRERQWAGFLLWAEGFPLGTAWAAVARVGGPLGAGDANGGAVTRTVAPSEYIWLLSYQLPHLSISDYHIWLLSYQLPHLSGR